MKKVKLLFFCFLLSKISFGQTARVYIDPFGSSTTTTGSVKLRVYNSSYDVTTTYDFGTKTYSNSPLSPPVGSNYSLEITNLTNKQIAYNMCQFSNVCDPNLGKFSACGEYSPDNPSTDSYSVIVPIGSTINIKNADLKILSKSGYQTVCQSNIGESFNYELGSIHVRLSYDNRSVCENINDIKINVSSNAEYVNDSTYKIVSGSTLNLSAFCSGIAGYNATFSNGSSSLSEVITTNKTYSVNCTSNSSCSKARNVTVNVFGGCNLSSNISSVTGIVLNNNYSGPFVFEIFAPAPTGSTNGTYEVSDGTNVWLTGSFNQLRYDAAIGAYHIETSSWVGGSVATPERKSGYIKVKIGTEQVYKVNYQYTSFGAFMAGSDGSNGYNTVKPQGLSVTYSTCFDGKSKVYGNSEAKIQDNNYSSQTIKMRLREISPTVGSDLIPIFERKFEFNGNGQDGYDGGAVWDLGFKNTGQTYTFRVIGTSDNAESIGDFSDISFTPTCPNPQISATKSIICLGETVALTATGCSGNICWNTGQTTTTISVKPSVTTTYKVACNTTEGDYSSISAQISVLNNTNILSLSSNKTDNAVQPLESITLTASGCTGGVVKWDDGYNGDIRIESPTKTKDYYAYCQVGNCNSAVSKITVNVKSNVPTVVVETPEYCETTDNVVKLTASGCTGTYSWSDGTTGSIKYVGATTSLYWVLCSLNGVDSAKKYIKLK